MSVPTSSNEAPSAFEKAISLFPLQNPDPATDEAWELYTINRLQAPRRVFDDEDEQYEEKPEVDREFFYAIGYAMSALEKEMKLKPHILYEGYRMIDCTGYYAENYKRDACEVLGPEDVRTLSRIYSPTRPVYIDVHFSYHYLWGDEDIGFEYRIGLKIVPFPAKDDYNPRRSYEMEIEKPEDAYNSNGWRPLAYGQNLPGWPRQLRHVFGLNNADVQDICEALWGPQENLPEDADDEKKLERRRLLVNSVRVLLAAAGIECKIACIDEEKDWFTYWQLARIRDWICREIRNACGFQLERDLAEVSQDAFVQRPDILSIDAECDAIYDELSSGDFFW